MSILVGDGDMNKTSIHWADAGAEAQDGNIAQMADATSAVTSTSAAASASDTGSQVEPPAAVTLQAKEYRTCVSCRGKLGKYKCAKCRQLL
jgi:hypothetical protein